MVIDRSYDICLLTQYILSMNNTQLLLNSTRSPAQGPVVTYGVGWRGGAVRRHSRREGIYVDIGLIHFVVQQKPTQHCKAIILQ